MKAILPILLLLPLSLAGDPGGLPADLVARLGKEPVTLAEYKDYLYLTLARSRLEDLLEFKLLRREAKRLGRAPTPKEVTDRLKSEKSAMLRTRFKGDEQLMVRTLLGQGYSLPEMDRWLSHDLEKRMLQERIIRAARTPTPDRLQRKFEELYGQGGVRVAIRQIQISMGPLIRTELKRVGSIADLDRPALEARALTRAKKIKALLDQGEPFGRVCLEKSDDPAVKSLRGTPRGQAEAGRVRGYNYRQFGAPFAAAVRALKVGGLSAPIPFRSEGNLVSYHLILLEGRVTTRIADVRARVVEAIRREPIHFYDRVELKQRLLASPQVTTRSSDLKGCPHDHEHGEKKR